MNLVFWGVRGSIPVPGPQTVRYGGNTSCVQLDLGPGQPVLIFDAGTGIRALGKQLVAIDERLDIHIFITHAHWDHIQGLPFFDPLFQSNCSITFYSIKRPAHDLKDVVCKVIESRYFPLSHENWEARIKFVEFQDRDVFHISDEVQVATSQLNHPWLASAYRVDHRGASMVYATDTAPFEHVILDWDFISKAPNVHAPVEDGVLERLQAMRRNLVELCKGADVVIYDTMFTDAQYERNPHWGHSAPSHALQVCKESRVPHLIMFHHAPEKSDQDMDALLKEAQALGATFGVTVTAAMEGATLPLQKEQP